MKRFDRIIQSLRIRKIRSYIPSNARVLDIGSSDGALFFQIPAIGEYVGIEPELSESRQIAPNAMLLKGFFPAVLMEERPFDVVTLLAVLEHIPPAEQQPLASGCAKYLKPGGRLIITVPSPAADYVLWFLRTCRAIDGMSLEQHYGFKPQDTPGIFTPSNLRLVHTASFQFGLNNLFVFEKKSVATADASESH
jgi:2-polyprenyl-3-methyl-5-hydroxy-6-metoxy-1,4-benzoquinol methylase